MLKSVVVDDVLYTHTCSRDVYAISSKIPLNVVIDLDFMYLQPLVMRLVIGQAD